MAGNAGIRVKSYGVDRDAPDMVTNTDNMWKSRFEIREVLE